MISAELGKGNKGTGYVLRKLHEEDRSWTAWIFGKHSEAYSFQIADRDENGFRALSELSDRGINLVANALAQSTDHILSFFQMLRTELAFYIGCLKLHEQLVRKGESVCFPEPIPARGCRLSFAGLYDVCLALRSASRVVGNDLRADGKRLVMITGANQGGKSTFLRSVGLAQLMMQCGMFVPAASFRANVASGLFTHCKREEDTTMRSGKLDEELSRMSDIVDRARPNSIILFNESFAETNEREGSEIAGQIVSALLDSGMKVLFVTHMFELAEGFFQKNQDTAVFLRAQRHADGARTFKLIVGEPLRTSYGEDLYHEVFASDSPLRGEPARMDATA